jgi:hypothetical protein
MRFSDIKQAKLAGKICGNYSQCNLILPKTGRSIMDKKAYLQAESIPLCDTVWQHKQLFALSN